MRTFAWVLATAAGMATLPVGRISAGEPILVEQATDVQAGGGFSLTETYDRDGLPVPHWSIHIAPGGAVEYTSHHATAGVSDENVRFTLSATGQTRLGKAVEESHDLKPCETKTKGLARMGAKHVVYAPAGGAEVHCDYNYTDNKGLQQMTEYLSNVSYTLEEGATIDRLHRYDRLGLDPVLIRLAGAAKDGRAPELAAIRTSLEALAVDDAVLERVRMRATELLNAAKLQ